MEQILDYTESQKKTTIAFFNSVYGYMTAGLLLTAFVSIFVANQGFTQFIFANKIHWALFIAELGLVWYLSSRISQLSKSTALLLFLFYSALNGATLSAIFFMYSKGSIASAFFITAGTFAAMSIYGFVTKSDLTKIGNIAMMALIGVVIASIVNIFMKSPVLYWIITYLGVAIFVGLVAYDTQKLKRIVESGMDDHQLQKYAVFGALTLYLDFINLFIYILRIVGNRD